MPYATPRPAVCIECAARFESRHHDPKFCTQRCRSRYKEARRTAPSNRRHVCRWCDSRFQSRTSGVLYCTETCRLDAWLDRHHDGRCSVVPWAECDWCGSWFVSRGGRKLCSRRCQEMRHRKVTVRSIEYADCARCGSLFVHPAGRGDKCCSERCKRALRKRHREHMKRTAPLPPERISVLELGNRDGWVCHLCDGAVLRPPWAARPDDATIDHLIPVSKGGPHTWANVALAHFECNSLRGARDLEVA